MKYCYIQAQPALKVEVFLTKPIFLQHHILLAFNGLHCVRAIAMLRLYYRHEVHLMMAPALLLHFLPLYDPPFLPLLMQSKPALKSMLQGAGRLGRACQFYRAINFFAQLPPNAPTFSALCTAPPRAEKKSNVALRLVCPLCKSSCWLPHYTEFAVLLIF